MKKLEVTLGLAILSLVLVVWVIFSPHKGVLGGSPNTGFNAVSISETLAVTGATTLTGALNANGNFVLNGQTSSISTGNFAAASTTVFAVQNPSTTATTTVDLLIYNQTGQATSTYMLTVGTSTSAFIAPNCVSTCLINASSTTFATRDVIATSTSAYIVNGDTGTLFGNNFTNLGVNKLVVAPAQWIVGFVETPNGVATTRQAFTDTGHTYAGTYFIRWIR